MAEHPLFRHWICIGINDLFRNHKHHRSRQSRIFWPCQSSIPLHPINKQNPFSVSWWIIEKGRLVTCHTIGADTLSEWCLTYDMHAFTLHACFLCVCFLSLDFYENVTKNKHRYKLKTMYEWRTLFWCDVADVHFTVISFETLTASFILCAFATWNRPIELDEQQ